MPNPQAIALPKLHRLKTDPEVYQAVLAGSKTFEIRLNDRDFHVGDELLLMETVATGEAIKAGAPLQYTGNEMRKRVSHVLSGYGLIPGWVCLSFEAGRAAASGQAGWQPIESAPKDGTAIYVVVADALRPEAGVAHWFSDTWRGGQDIDWQGTESPHEHFGIYPSPTHWMPLPAAPGATSPSALVASPPSPDVAGEAKADPFLQTR